MDDCFHCYVRILLITNIYSGAIPVVNSFSFHGSPDPTDENRDKMGGSALFAVYLLCLWGFGAKKMVSIYEKQEERQVASAGDDVGSVSAYDCTTRRVTWAVRQRRQS